jgi:hypothetical protein
MRGRYNGFARAQNDAATMTARAAACLLPRSLMALMRVAVLFL